MNYLKWIKEYIFENKNLEMLDKPEFLQTLDNFLEIKYWEGRKNISEEEILKILKNNRMKIKLEIEHLQDKFLLQNGNIIDIRKNTNNIKFSLLLLNSGMFKTYQKRLKENNIITEEILYADQNTIVLKKGVELTYFDKQLLYSILAYSNIQENVLKLDLYQLRKHLGMNTYTNSDKMRIINSLENLSMSFLKIRTKYFITNNDKVEINQFFNLFNFSETQVRDNNEIVIELTKQFYELLALRSPENKLTFRYINMDKFSSLKEPLSKLIYERLLILGKNNYTGRFYEKDSIKTLSEKSGFIIPTQIKKDKKYVANDKLLKQLKSSEKELLEKLNIELIYSKSKENIYEVKYRYID